jgi:hypothetical protein
MMKVNLATLSFNTPPPLQNLQYLRHTAVRLPGAVGGQTVGGHGDPVHVLQDVSVVRLHGGAARPLLLQGGEGGEDPVGVAQGRLRLRSEEGAVAEQVHALGVVASRLCASKADCLFFTQAIL